MEPFPHRYEVSASSTADGIHLQSPGLADLTADKPAEFDGPGDQWSPETLFVASVSSCMILSFKAVAAASKFDFVNLQCETTGVLDRVEKKPCFTTLVHHVTLEIEDASQKEKAEKLVEKAESICLVSNSLTAEVELNVSIVTSS